MTPARYADVGALLDHGEVKPPAPTVGLRDDGIGLFYRGQLNLIFGNPESGKTLTAQCALVDELSRGNSGLIIDLDHNGAAATVHRLVAMGADDTVLRDLDRFRYAAPEDAQEILALVADAAVWRPSVVIVDSIGELLPLFAASSNSPDDFTRVHTATLKPLAASGAAVIGIDHLAKNTDSAAYGSTGTAAKKRAIGGTSLRCAIIEPFIVGQGGKAQLTVNKDRHGGLRAACPAEDREPLAAVFILTGNGGDVSWRFAPPKAGQHPADTEVPEGDVRALTELQPPPTSQRDVKERLGWGSTRALNALRAWRTAGAPTVLPAPPTPMWGAQEHPLISLPERSRSSKPVLPAPPHTPSGARSTSSADSDGPGLAVGAALGSTR